MTDHRPAKTVPVPRLASDTCRTWVAAAVAFVPMLLLSIVLVAFGLDEAISFDSVIFGFANWFLFGVAYLWLTVRTFSGTDAETLTHWLRASTPRSRTSRLWLMLSGGSGRSWATQGAVVAVVVVVTLSISAESRSSMPLMISAVFAVTGSWVMILAAFAMQYARADTDEQGLDFPGDAAPVFSDYCYLAVQVSTTFSGADVAIVSRTLRRMVTWHSLIAFAFNSVIIATLVSALLAS